MSYFDEDVPEEELLSECPRRVKRRREQMWNEVNKHFCDKAVYTGQHILEPNGKTLEDCPTFSPSSFPEYLLDTCLPYDAIPPLGRNWEELAEERKRDRAFRLSKRKRMRGEMLSQSDDELVDLAPKRRHTLPPEEGGNPPTRQVHAAFSLEFSRMPQIVGWRPVEEIPILKHPPEKPSKPSKATAPSLHPEARMPPYLHLRSLNREYASALGFIRPIGKTGSWVPGEDPAEFLRPPQVYDRGRFQLTDRDEEFDSFAVEKAKRRSTTAKTLNYNHRGIPVLNATTRKNTTTCRNGGSPVSQFLSPNPNPDPNRFR